MIFGAQNDAQIVKNRQKIIVKTMWKKYLFQKQNVFDEVEEGNPQVAEFRINESYFNEPSEQVI